jgi:TolB-like protein
MSTGQDRRQFPDLPVELKEWADSRAMLQLNEVVLKACAKDVTKRYRSAGEMHADLSRLQAGKSVRWRGHLGRVTEHAKRLWPFVAALMLLLLIVPWVLRQQESRPLAAATEKASVFVLPFRSEGANRVPDDLRGRITDAFIDSLAVIEGVRRSPRKSGWVHQDETTLRRSLAETNDMRHILTGSISGSGNALTIALRLYARGEDQPVWTESFSGTTNEVIALERRALAQIASVLKLRITEREQQKIDLLLTNNLEALGWMRRAVATYDSKAGTQAGCTEVQSLAQKALEFDPGYLEADCLDAVVLRDLAMERAPREGWPTVRLRMENILKQDDTHAGALDQLTGYMLFYARDWTATQALMERELAASSLTARAWLGAMLYRTHGWFDEARVLQEKSEQPEPSEFVHRLHMAASRRVERRYSEGVHIARRTVALYPSNGLGYLSLVHCLLGQDDFEPALEAIQKAQEVWPKQEMLGLRGYAYARMGQPDKAREVLRELMDQQRTSPYLQPYFVARVYAALREKAAALDWLEKADADRSEYLIFADLGGLRTDPAWDGLQNEPRYWQLCDRLGLGKRQWPRPKPERLP